MQPMPTIPSNGHNYTHSSLHLNSMHQLNFIITQYFYYTVLSLKPVVACYIYVFYGDIQNMPVLSH